MYKDFARRLHRDIKRMVDARVLQSQITSQMNMGKDQQISAKQIEVNVISHKKQRYAVWFGGSLLADTVTFVNLA
jgi:actin-related protein 3